MFMLRELRKAKGMTMKKLGDIIGVAESTISQYETGKREPDFETLLKFGEIFTVSTDYLLTGEQKEKAPAEAEDDIETMVDSILSELTNAKGDTLMLDGKPASAEALYYLRESIRANVEHAKKLNDEKKKRG